MTRSHVISFAIGPVTRPVVRKRVLSPGGASPIVLRPRGTVLTSRPYPGGARFGPRGPTETLGLHANTAPKPAAARGRCAKFGAACVAHVSPPRIPAVGPSSPRRSRLRTGAAPDACVDRPPPRGITPDPPASPPAQTSADQLAASAARGAGRSWATGSAESGAGDGRPTLSHGGWTLARHRRCVCVAHPDAVDRLPCVTWIAG